MTGSLAIEKSWIRAYFDENYLWPEQVPVVDAMGAAYTGSIAQLNTFNNVPVPLDNYFKALKSPQLTATGANLDRFSFTYNTADWTALSQAGQSFGYGMELVFVSKTVPRRLLVAYVDPATPAAAAGVQRGAELVLIDGVDVATEASQAGIDALNAGLYPSSGAAHSFTIRDAGSATTRSINLTPQVITSTPVQNVKTITVPGQPSLGTVGYVQFNDHIASSERQLVEAFNTLKAQNATDLVLDMRYNGGGFLYIASELAYMIAGPARTYNAGQSRVFEKLQFNAKRVADNNSARSSFPFYNEYCLDAACTGTAALPTLNLARVYVIAQSGTCSASESVINGLRGVGVQVILIGGTTCGKPYGFTAKDNCGVSYFPIEFKGTNALGFGDYADGFSPACAAADDYSKQLGDPAEGMLASALYAQRNGRCANGSAYATAIDALAIRSGSAASKSAQGDAGGIMLKHPVRESRWR